MSKLIYISGPILNGHTQSEDQGVKNAQLAMDLGRDLINKGWAVYCPHLTIFWYKYIKEHHKQDVPWNMWMRADAVLLDKTDAVFYMHPSKYGPSKGAEIEIRYMKKNYPDIPIYSDISEVPTLDEEGNTFIYDGGPMIEEK